MLNPVSLQLRVGVDVGSRCHSVAIGLSDGSLLEEFEIPHTAEGFQEFFARIEAATGAIRCRLQSPWKATTDISDLWTAWSGPGLAPVQRQQPEAGPVQGDLSGRGQERPDRHAQDPGAVPAR